MLDIGAKKVGIENNIFVINYLSKNNFHHE